MHTMVYALNTAITTINIIIYRIAQNRWGKTLANRSLQSFGEENIGEFNL